jgi:hypothetical protein
MGIRMWGWPKRPAARPLPANELPACVLLSEANRIEVRLADSFVLNRIHSEELSPNRQTDDGG